MAESKYLEYQGNNGLGTVGLSLQVFGLITKITTEETKDVRMDLSSHNFFNFGKGPIICELNNAQLNIQVEVNIKYGKNVNKTTKNLQNRIAKAISDMTDVKVSSVNVKVVGVDF